MRSTTNMLIFSSTSFASRNLSSSVWSYNNFQKWLTHLSKNELFYQQFQTILLQSRISPPPESMLFADEVRFEGLKHNNDLWEGWGGGTRGQAKDMSTMQKRGHSMEVSQPFVPHCRTYV